MMEILRLVLVVVATISMVAGFLPQPRQSNNVFEVFPRRTSNNDDAAAVKSTSSARNMILLGGGDEVLPEAVDAARGEFLFWFFGASGAVGISLGQFPEMIRRSQYIQGLKGIGPTLGGETLGLNPLCGYPEDLAVKDVQKILNNPLSIQQIVQRYPSDGTYLGERGYLTFSRFEAANADANPLAVRAIFDSFAQSTDNCSPVVAEEKLEEYRNDINTLKGVLLQSKVQGWLSIAALLFLLAVPGCFLAGLLYEGWFPDWPGGRSFPQSLSDPNDGALWNIPKYWI